MINIGIAELSKNPSILDRVDDVATIINKKNREIKGYFIPSSYHKQLKSFIENIEQEKKRELLKRVAKASRKDPIGDGAIDDGI